MLKVYEANSEEKERILDSYIDSVSYDKARINDITEDDLMLITRVKNLPSDRKINAIWSLNGIDPKTKDLGEILIFEPFKRQMETKRLSVGPNNTRFVSGIELSDKAIVLMPVGKYDELMENEKSRKILNEYNVRLYEGEENLATKMLMFDKGFFQVDVDEDGYVEDEEKHLDKIRFIRALAYYEDLISEQNLVLKLSKPVKMKGKGKSIYKQTGNYRMITGMTVDKEGDIDLDEEMHATTDIGKTRENQEDAVLLIKNEKNPDFKMMVVADGMGGREFGEVASDIIINKLKDWFEGLSRKQSELYYKDVKNSKEDLIDKIELDVQSAVSYGTWRHGGSTLVCALIGKENTLVLNVGDSRAYIAKDGKLKQLSREDTKTQIILEQGEIPSKESSRFDKESNVLLQSIGMDRNQLMHPHTEIIKNTDYDLLLLFTDGVTDCLSDEDIIAVCRNSDKTEIANKIVGKAIRHDSIAPEEYSDYSRLSAYIPGGKDNTTAAVYAPNKRKGEREHEK